MIRKLTGSVLAAGIIFMFFSICGIIVIYSFVENIEYNTNVFYAVEENDMAGVENNEKTQNIAKNKVKLILDSDVKTKISVISPNSDKIICYTRNIYMELDADSMCPVLYIYECKKGRSRYTEEECRLISMKFALRNIPRVVKVNGSRIECTGKEEDVFSYKIFFGEDTVLVSVRGDTGSIVFYDASQLFDYI